MAKNDKIHEFCRLQITVYQGSRAIQIVPGAKKKCAIAHEMARMTKFTSFVDLQIAVYRGSRVVEIVPGAKNRVL